ncbi:Fis family transcriptional regulator [Pseudomonas aeruginosa]|uniref:sigma-54 interaction domain-containing protein n=1 Tax=Pseudomonas aeruginosa TaxID=287 RepID=UPI00071BB532|nr:sigma-54-dependent transcriptional regulator [Pseudomonas aeruginosa]KSC72262.1 Fis family transcriptional regulator [Pseudomonas aeruginosa]KSS17893.1 Fis family transcriptional regulator [Pseudomonas aeruginosa]
MSVITHPHARELTKSVRATVLVFNDPRSRELLERIERLAPSEANALVIGETGTGKELVARHIHALSGRNGGPFVAVNCGAFAESLVESELFGHEKGAFTGALQSKAGWFEAANGGTLFLDEIGDLPPSIQVKLLRVLQEREVVRLGSRRPIPIDVRLVAATNVDLADAVVAGHFREDLYYRLHVATIQLPPLRERRGDILPLAEYFIVEHCRRLGYTSASLSPEAERKLLGHSWAGNIRELENAIHHALLVCRNRLIQPADLHLIDMRARQEPNGLRRAPESAAGSALEAALQALFEENREDLYEHIEETVFRAAYRFCHGNQLQTGRLLGISRNIVRARLEKIGELETSPRHNVVSLVGK